MQLRARSSRMFPKPNRDRSTRDRLAIRRGLRAPLSFRTAMLPIKPSAAISSYLRRYGKPPKPDPSIKQIWSRIPKSLQRLPGWYLTERPDTPVPFSANPLKRRVSPITLAPLRLDWSDYSDLETALDALDGHPHWFDSLGLRLRWPLFAMVVLYCYQPSNKLERSTRVLMKSLGGYWERGQRDSDAQGLLWTNKPILTREMWVGSNRVYICADSLLNLTGRYFHGLTGDPILTNQEELAKCFKQI